jgi:2-amino-4-hydroxy-6-hydroxymethyldihydropteridine diphosphokinase
LSQIAYVGFGSNLGDRRAKFEETLNALAQLPCTTMTGTSSLYETVAVGLSDGGGPFINVVIRLDTDLSPGDLGRELRRIDAGKARDPQERHVSGNRP